MTELREKLLWKSGEEIDGEQFSPELIQRKFLRSLETGLLSDAVKFQIKPIDDPNVADVVLIEKLGEAAILELERQTKLRKAVTPKPFKLSEVQTVEHPGESRQFGSEAEAKDREKESSGVKDKKKQGWGKDADTDTTKAIEDLKANVMEMTKLFVKTRHENKTKYTI